MRRELDLFFSCSVKAVDVQEKKTQQISSVFVVVLNLRDHSLQERELHFKRNHLFTYIHFAEATYSSALTIS